MMTSVATRVVKQRGIVVALATSVIVLVVMMVQAFLNAFAGGLQSVFADGGNSFATAWSGLYALQNLLTVIPFAAGVFLALWIIAPIAAPLRLFHVVTRSLLAAALGAVLALIVTGIASIPAAFAYSGGLSSNLFRNLTVGDQSGFSALGNALGTGIRVFADSAPLVVLAGVLLWIWLERHPRDHHVSGMLDEV